MSLRVLLVEDSQTQALSLKLHLERFNFIVDIAASGSSAIASVFRQPPDAILLDINLPDMDGYQVSTVFQANPATARIPTIFLTSRTSVHDMVRAKHLGGLTFIIKDHFLVYHVLAALRQLKSLSISH